MDVNFHKPFTQRKAPRKHNSPGSALSVVVVVHLEGIAADCKHPRDGGHAKLRTDYGLV